MDFRDRTTDAALADIARLLSIAYVRYRRIESAARQFLFRKIAWRLQAEEEG